MSNPDLKTWFNDAISQGHTVDELIPHLKEHGYTDEMINPVVDELKSELNKVTESQQTVENSESKNTEPQEQIIEAEPENDEIKEEVNNNLEDQDNAEAIETENNSDSTIQSLDQDLESDSNEERELTMQELEKEFDKELETTTSSGFSIGKILLPLIILVCISAASYLVYTKYTNTKTAEVNNSIQSPVIPSFSFSDVEEETTVKETETFINEESDPSTLLEENKIQEENKENSSTLRKFKKELYFN